MAGRTLSPNGEGEAERTRSSDEERSICAQTSRSESRKQQQKKVSSLRTVVGLLAAMWAMSAVRGPPAISFWRARARSRSACALASFWAWAASDRTDRADSFFSPVFSPVFSPAAGT